MFFHKNDHLFLNLISFFIFLKQFKVAQVHQIKIYINYLSIKDKCTTYKSYEKDECVES
jgi:hypothetical protein